MLLFIAQEYRVKAEGHAAVLHHLQDEINIHRPFCQVSDSGQNYIPKFGEAPTGTCIFIIIHELNQVLLTLNRTDRNSHIFLDTEY